MTYVTSPPTGEKFTVIDDVSSKTPATRILTGAAGALTEVSATDRFPVETRAATNTASGSITTQNLVPAGKATAGSAVELTLYDCSVLTFQITGTYTGALSVQVTVNGGTWVTLAAATSLINAASGAYSATVASATQGIFMVDCSGYAKIRVTGLAAVTGTATVAMAGNQGANMVALDNPLPAGSASIGSVVIASGTVTTVSAVSSSTPVTPTASNINSAATTNATSIKATAGTLFNIGASNTGAAAAFIKLYNKATAPTVGTDVPVLTLAVPAGGNVDFDLGPLGHRFSTGIAMAITNLAADSDTTAVAAAQVKVLTSYL